MIEYLHIPRSVYIDACRMDLNLRHRSVNSVDIRQALIVDIGGCVHTAQIIVNRLTRIRCCHRRRGGRCHRMRMMITVARGIDTVATRTCVLIIEQTIDLTAKHFILKQRLISEHVFRSISSDRRSVTRR